MPKLESPLLFKLVIALAIMGLLPLLISWLQLRSNQDALVEQVQRTHIVAAKTAAARVDAFLSPYLDLARALAQNPALDKGSEAGELQELLRGTLAAQGELVRLRLLDRDGAEVLAAQRRDFGTALNEIANATFAGSVRLLRGEKLWLLVHEPLPQGGRLELVVDAGALELMVQADELGEEAQLALVDNDLTALIGSVGQLPSEMLEQVRAGQLASGCKIYREPEGKLDLVVAHARVTRGPWLLVSRQPARIAEVARERIRQATFRSAGLALFLTALIAGGAFLTVIQPLRRLAAAQRQLAGIADAARRGSEISDLEQTFALLQQKVRNREDLGQVKVGRYQITQLIGSGAMGSVFKAWDEKLKRPVALKTIHVNADEVDRFKLLRSLRDEAAITSKIHQPNIVTVYDIEEEGHSAFIAMEYVEGVNLQSLLETRGYLKSSALVPIATGIGRGLATAHAHGLVHHDVKPANVLLGTSGSVKLVDFGVSQLITSSAKSRDVICGTPGYLAPECFEGGTYTPLSDLFAFGVLIYESLLGHHPFRGGTLRETVSLTLSKEPDSLHVLDPEIPLELSDLVDRLLAKEPGERPQSAQEAVEVLEELEKRGGYTWSPQALSDVKNSWVGSPTSRPTRLLTVTFNDRTAV